jgi:hypothetical protein
MIQFIRNKSWATEYNTYKIIVSNPRHHARTCRSIDTHGVVNGSRAGSTISIPGGCGKYDLYL